MEKLNSTDMSTKKPMLRSSTVFQKRQLSGEIDMRTPRATQVQKEEKIGVIPFAEYLIMMQTMDFFVNSRVITKEQEIENEKELIEYQKRIDLHHKQKEIEQMKKQVLKLEEKIQRLNEVKKHLDKIISNKKNNLKVAQESHKTTVSNYTQEKEKNDKNVNKIVKYKIVYNSLIYKKIMEISYVFFNSRIDSLFFAPVFDKTKTRYDAYQAEPKKYGRMMGNIAFLLSYLSRTLNLTLRFPIFAKGSKSYCIINKKEYGCLFCDPKNDDRFAVFEKAMRFQKENIRELLFFLSQFDNLISHKKLEDITSVYSMMSLFDIFIEFNQILYHFVDKMSKEEERYRN